MHTDQFRVVNIQRSPLLARVIQNCWFVLRDYMNALFLPEGGFSVISCPIPLKVTATPLLGGRISGCRGGLQENDYRWDGSDLNSARHLDA